MTLVEENYSVEAATAKLTLLNKPAGNIFRGRSHIEERVYLLVRIWLSKRLDQCK